MNLPPTPAKNHYTFNLRDLSSVFNGILLAPINVLKTTGVMKRLWVHECLRVFSDRLICDEDKEIFLKMLQEGFSEYFETNWEEFIGSKEILFCSVLGDRAYTEVQNTQYLKNSLENALFDYNNQDAAKLNIVLFDFAL